MLLFGMVHIDHFAKLNYKVRSEMPFSCFRMMSFFTSIVVLTDFLFAFTFSLTFFDPLVARGIKKYKK